MTQKMRTRRDFLRLLAIGGGGIIVLGNYRFLFANQAENGVLKAIIVDFDKCAGCRTCETVCSAYQHQVVIDGEKLHGLGNPKLANIKVMHHNPDVDIPTVCTNCPESLCIKYCPSEPDPVTGYKAIYRDPETLAINTNHKQCISCGSCASNCEREGAGIIVMNPVTEHPEHICDHCGGDPQCVKHCPYGALTFKDVDVTGAYFGMTHTEIAEKLFERYYAN
ncbi:MAG TPA: 4Fe-4S dicluster domain-containing protein [Lentimicrobium sp.]|nr:4Fe-4S dicluster domain-containing protein [Lentimicrobium sp.]